MKVLVALSILLIVLVAFSWRMTSRKENDVGANDKNSTNTLVSRNGDRYEKRVPTIGEPVHEATKAVEVEPLRDVPRPPLGAAEMEEIRSEDEELQKVVDLYNSGKISFRDVLDKKRDRLHLFTGFASTYSDFPRKDLIRKELEWNRILLDHAIKLSNAAPADVDSLKDEIAQLEVELQGGKLTP